MIARVGRNKLIYRAACEDAGQLRDIGYDANGNITNIGLTLSGALVDRYSNGYDMSDRKTLGLDAGGNLTTYRKIERRAPQPYA